MTEKMLTKMPPTITAPGRSRHSHDLTVVMGDLNAKVGRGSMYCNRAIEKYGCGTRDENGERLIDLYNMNNLVIGGTPFPTLRHPQKPTWRSPYSRDKNQIDHLIVNDTWNGRQCEEESRCW